MEDLVKTDSKQTNIRRNTNIRSHLTRAKVSTAHRDRRYLKGMQKCGNPCTACTYIKEGKKIKINNVDWNLNKSFDCSSYNLVYAIFCEKENCKKVYIGETKRMLRFRLADHRGYISRGDKEKATCDHFNLPGHSLADLRVTVLEHT